MQTRSLPCDWPGVGSPGSRATSFHTCQVLRPRRVLQALALNAPVCIAFRLRNGVSTRNMNLCGAQWLAYVLLCRRFAAAIAGDRARLGVDVDRSGRTEARTGLRMMPTSPRSPRSFRPAGFPRYGWKAGLSDGAFPIHRPT